MTIKRMIAAASMFATFAVAPLPAEGQNQDSVEGDRAALVAIYNAMDGPNWGERASHNWLSDRPIGDWAGVDTNLRSNHTGRGRVISLDLPRTISGSIPREIGNLTGLLSLRTSHHNTDRKLSGPIPREIERLQHLVTLHLANHNLSGRIPELGNIAAMTRDRGISSGGYQITQEIRLFGIS